MLKRLDELIDVMNPAWPMIQQWVKESNRPVQILEVNKAQAENSLLKLQVTTHSTLGAIVYESGGLLLDHGWLRVLGSGHPKLPRSIPDWNYDRTWHHKNMAPPMLLVADDILGGFFGINGGMLNLKLCNVCYLAPDTFKWEDTGKGYSDFLHWTLSGDMDLFYEGYRWPGWSEEVSALCGDQGFSIFPFLGTQGPPIAERSRRPISIDELYKLHA